MRPKPNPHAEYRQKENLRISASPSLAARFPGLKSLTAVLAYYESDGMFKTTEIKYTANLDHANSVFSFTCVNNECVGGDFDLSEELARAVGGGVATVAGEMCCQGWQSKISDDSHRCHRILRYKLQMGY
jgi:hypothetical protein